MSRARNPGQFGVAGTEKSSWRRRSFEHHLEEAERDCREDGKGTERWGQKKKRKVRERKKIGTRNIYIHEHFYIERVVFFLFKKKYGIKTGS